MSAQRGTGALLAATAFTGAANYGLSLILVHLLSPGEFSRFAAVSTLLLTVGTVAGAAVPWVLARETALSGRGDPRRRQAIRFGLIASLVLGVVAATAVVFAAASYSGTGLLLGAAAATVLILLCAVGVGVLQGEQSFLRLAGVRVLEVAIRITLAVLAALVGWGSAGVIGAFAVGAGTAALWSLLAVGRDLWAPSTGTVASETWTLARHAGALAAGQAALSLLLSLDVIIGAAVQAGGDGLAGYQALLVLARVPLFLATALATAVFPRLVSTTGTRTFLPTLRTFLILGAAITAAVASVPAALVEVVLPTEYVASLHLLAPLALAGFGGALATLLVAYLQARERLGAAVAVLTVALVAAGCGYPLAAPDPSTLAWASAVAMLGASAGLLTIIKDTRVVLTAVGPLLLGGAAWLVLHSLTGHLVSWLICAAVVGGAAVLLVRPRPRPEGPLRILHLGFEDPARPGAGGGSVRTHEVNRRIVDSGAEVVVMCSRYPGFAEREQDGVRYVPCGIPVPGGHFPSLLSYFAAVLTGLWQMERRFRPDVIVEDFAAPFSSIAVPYLTRTPVVGVVQWLFAADKTAQYHLPFHLVEALGVKAHDKLIAVSEDLAQELRTRNPAAEVHALPNGLEPAAWQGTAAFGRGDHILFLGRLEIAQKGMDLLLDAYAAAAPYLSSDLHLAGDGPDEAVLRERARRLGIEDRVRWLGRVSGAARFDLLARARLVCMPSRYETFGMVAAEALAVGTPVVAFDIPCLRALVQAEVGVPVPAGDVGALTEALISLANDPARCRRLGAAGPPSVRHLDWDTVAADQLAIYRSVVPLWQGVGRAEDAVLHSDQH
ncbi:glycosyltransferase [Actinoplanes friuliensis]|uniref:Phosphatidylinositol alpha-mannosyltransferase n=1 Tax=Actinoplanes friuliensis DSM 7358 TaxID=1246995 RepID=U5VP41_9ACTN|nr:glycosyltransferase [Actinoplanes friuliensis]AGZ38544.1 phosphatidylinositol alpha-mannosyltransferase [Actinoplanes friuliensis DSM 7358]